MSDDRPSRPSSMKKLVCGELRVRPARSYSRSMLRDDVAAQIIWQPASRAIPIAQDISHAFTDLDELQKIGHFTINISGCMNACGHHHVGHIGILGVDKRGEEFFPVGEDALPELRLDLFPELDPEALVEALEGRCLVTCRRASEGAGARRTAV